ncbi:MAG: flavodoxin FldB [Gammaproteobacteria bacterium]|nr:MAG: flavodoxin FldB [Gammaproteobacteria bacterium]
MPPAPIGLFYGSSTCYTEMVAEKIAAELGEALVDVHNIADTPVSTMTGYELLILGIPTWDYGELQEDWENCWDELDSLDLHGKTVALYGLGDQVGYPEWFLDALGYLWAKVRNLGANTVGYWPVDGFEFEESKALTEDEHYFVGLAIDDENQFDLTDQRIKTWCSQIRGEFGLD